VSPPRGRIEVDALFIGHAYIDVTMVTDEMPSGDEKTVARDYAVSFGGNAVTAGFACAKLGHDVHILTTQARDWLGHMFAEMADVYGVHIHPRKVARSSLSFVLPNNGKRAILRARDDNYLQPFIRLDISGARLLHLDGHMADAAIHYARAARESGVIVSLDGGALRPRIDELIDFVDVAVVSKKLCEQKSFSETEMLAWLKSKGCHVGAVTVGEKGTLWYAEDGIVQHLPALRVPPTLVIDTSGAGDVFHGAYCASYLDRPDASWREHFDFARAASAYKVQHLGNEAGLPSQSDIATVRETFAEGSAAPA
jgi:sulfofructose kinase